MRYMEKLITALDRLPERFLLVADAMFAAFIILGHGGALVLTLVQPNVDSQAIRQLSAISLPLAAIVLSTSAYAYFSERRRPIILKIHAIILLLANVGLVLWALPLLFGEFPRGSFSWSPGMMTGLFAYSVYLCRRAWFAESIASSALIRYSHLMAILIVLPVDISIFLKFLYLMSTGHFFR